MTKRVRSLSPSQRVSNWRASISQLRACGALGGALFGLAALAASAQAQDNYTYTGASPGTTTNPTSTTFTGAFTDTSSGATFTTPSTTTVNGTLTFGGGTNTYTATDNIANLTLSGLSFTNTGTASTGSFPTGSTGSVTINASNGATINGTGTTLGFAVSGGSVVFNPAIFEGAATLTFTGATAAKGFTQLNGVISGSGGLTDNSAGSNGTSAAGNVDLIGANTYSGITNIGAGVTLLINNVTALGMTGANNGTIVASTGELDIQSLAVGTSAENITISGTGVGSNTGAIRVVGNLNLSGAISLGADATIYGSGSTVSNLTGTVDLATHTLTYYVNANTLISAPITSTGGGGGLMKTGGAVLTLSSTSNSYSGATTVSAGNLLVTGNIASSASTVNSGATISGTGTLGPVTVTDGTISAGAAAAATPAVGTLTVGALTLTSTSTFNALLASNTSFSKLTSSGTTALAGNFSINLTPGATFTPGALELITSPVTGTFTDSAVTAGNYTFTADYTTNPGFFDVDVSMVPEPATWLSGFLMVGVLGVSQRRKIKSYLRLSRG